MRLRLALAGALIALPALATVIVDQTFEQLAHYAPLVVRARVGQSQAMWNEQHTSIETWVEVIPTEVLKGPAKPGTSIMLRSPGGVVGELGSHVAGAPTFTDGEDTLLFLVRAADNPNIWLIAGLSAGKVTFAPDAFGQVRATRDLRGISLYGTGRSSLRVLNKPEDLGTPEAFLARIRAAVTP